jgi:RimJ/RimL family protein N-acetyltransferase
MARLTTDRLILRPWSPDDARDALEVYGDPEIARWLVPAMSVVPDETTMRTFLREWIQDPAQEIPPCGHWALERRDDGRLVGGMSLRPLPPAEEDIEFSWQLARPFWGQGYAIEAARVLAAWAFTQGVEEVYAVMHSRNTRSAALARRLGMEWTGETDKYYGLHLNVYRLRPDNLGEERVESPRPARGAGESATWK